MSLVACRDRSNGNQLEAGKLPGGRHFTRWLDPFPKPCYIFALIGGDLGCLEDHYITGTGKDVTLRIWSEHDAVAKCGFAMKSLKESMMLCCAAPPQRTQPEHLTARRQA